MTLTSGDKRAVSGLVGDVAMLQRQVKLLASSKPGLAQSSIENGSIDGYDVEGNQTLQLGKQHDGTNNSVSLSGPKPPAPVAPSVVAVPGIVEVRWSGKFAGGLVSPMDLKHVAAYVVPVGEVLDLTVQAGVMTGELGDAVQVQVPEGVYNVYLVSWSLAGRFSDAAGPVPVLVPVAADMDAIQGALDDLDEKYDGVITEAGTLGTRLDAAEVDLGAHETRLSTAETDIDAALAGDVDVDRLAIGTGVIRQLVAEHIAAKTAVFQTVDVKNLFATTGTMSEAVINKLFADVVMSRKITTGMLAVGSFDNLVPEPDFTDGTRSWPTINTYATVEPELARNGGPALKFPPVGVDAACYAGTVRAEAGASYRFSAWVKSSAAQTGDWLYAGIRVKRSTGANAYLRVDQKSINADQWTQISGILTAPDDAVAMEARIGARVGTTSTLLVDYVSVNRANNGELTVDGTVKARHADLESFAADTGFIADLTARIVKADMFVGEEFQGGMFRGLSMVGSTIKTSETGRRAVLSADGIQVYSADDTIVASFPTTGEDARLVANLIAKSLTVEGDTTFRGRENELASNSKLTLRAGVSAPVSPASVGETYDSTKFPEKKIATEGSTGLAYAGGLWWRAINAKASRSGDRLEGIDSSGAVIKSHPISLDPHYGVTVVGSDLYVLGRGHTDPAGTVHVYAYSQSGAFLRKWEYSEYGSGTYQPGIGVSGSEILIAQCGADKKLTWRTFNPTTGTRTSLVTGNTFPGINVAGCYRGAADFGTTAVLVTGTDGSNRYFTPTGTWDAGRGWRSPDEAPVQGIAWDGTRFRTLTQDQRLYAYSKITNPDGDTYDWWATSTWSGAGGVETPMGPAFRFTLKRRAGVRISLPELPAGATGANIYLARKPIKPTRTEYRRLGSLSAGRLTLDELPVGWTTDPSPPASNTFPEATPAVLETSNKNFEVDGRGAGRWGPLEFHADGTMTSTSTPEWVPVTTFKLGFGPAEHGYVPAYRVWPDEKVEWRGTVAGSGSGFAIRMFTIPAEARPTKAVNWVGGASTATSGICRVEFGATTNGQDSQASPPTGTSFIWVSLDGLFYYRE